MCAVKPRSRKGSNIRLHITACFLTTLVIAVTYAIGIYEIRLRRGNIPYSCLWYLIRPDTIHTVSEASGKRIEWLSSHSVFTTISVSKTYLQGSSYDSWSNAGSNVVERSLPAALVISTGPTSHGRSHFDTTFEVGFPLRWVFASIRSDVAAGGSTNSVFTNGREEPSLRENRLWNAGVLPTRILPLNLFISFCCWHVVFLAILIPWRSWLHRSTMSDACTVCGYNCLGLTSCPECGASSSKV